MGIFDRDPYFGHVKKDWGDVQLGKVSFYNPKFGTVSGDFLTVPGVFNEVPWMLPLWGGTPDNFCGIMMVPGEGTYVEIVRYGDGSLGAKPCGTPFNFRRRAEASATPSLPVVQANELRFQVNRAYVNWGADGSLSLSDDSANRLRLSTDGCVTSTGKGLFSYSQAVNLSAGNVVRKLPGTYFYTEPVLASAGFSAPQEFRIDVISSASPVLATGPTQVGNVLIGHRQIFDMGDIWSDAGVPDGLNLLSYTAYDATGLVPIDTFTVSKLGAVTLSSALLTGTITLQSLLASMVLKGLLVSINSPTITQLAARVGDEVSMTSLMNASAFVTWISQVTIAINVLAPGSVTPITPIVAPVKVGEITSGSATVKIGG